MKLISYRSAVAAAALLLMQGGIASASAVEIAMSCGSNGKDFEECQKGAQAWEKKTGNKVKLVSTPASTSERLALFQQLLAAGAPDVDVFFVDVVWPGILGQHFIDMNKYIDKATADSYFKPMLENNIVDGKLVALPWFTDAGVLYYRADLLEKYGEKAPQTWDDLARVAQKIQEGERAAGNDKMWGFVWQGRAYEGLTCNAIEWVDSFGGGSLIDANGKVTVNNPNAAKALSTVASWVGKISPEGVLNYQEEDARGVFQAGNAVFMRNWPYAYALANGADSPIKGKVEVVALPKGPDGKHSGALGGWQLAVSKYSKHPDEAADLVKFLASSEEQKRRAIEGGFNPTIKALYQDQEILNSAPFFGKLYDTFQNAVARPAKVTGSKYNQVSTEFWNAVHRVLAGEMTAEKSLQDLEQKLQRVGRNGKWS